MIDYAFVGNIAQSCDRFRSQMRIIVGLYRTTFFSHWILFFIFIGLWANSTRPWSAIGISLDLDLWFAVGVALTIIGIAGLVMQNRKVQAATPEELDDLRKSLDRVSILIPQNGNELARFYGLSITAGIVEEVLWRGFLIWYLSQFMPVWGAALISTIGFGLAHAYQGLRQVPQIMIVGAAFASLYLLTGSVWLAIILHIAVDVLQGRMGYDVMHRSNIGGGAPKHAAYRGQRKRQCFLSVAEPKRAPAASAIRYPAPVCGHRCG